MPLWIIVAILGVVEGITEFLPISSTGHLLIAEKLFQLLQIIPATHWLVKSCPQKDLFNIVIQSGAVLAVLPLFPERLHQFLFNWKDRATQVYAGKILLAFVLTGIGGFILDKKGFKLPEELQPVAIALFLGGLGFVLVEAWLRNQTMRNEVTWIMAWLVGVGQLIAAAFPGTSRSGITILLCLILGLNRSAATEFCFLVGIPTMLAAGGWKIFKALRHHQAGAMPESWNMVLLGFVCSAIVSFVAVRWLLRYIQTHTFVSFGWYRMASAAVIVGLMLAGHHSAAAQAANSLTPDEKSSGWKLLFDGQSTRGWHSFKKQSFPSKGWIVEDGWLHCLGKDGGDVLSDEQFSQFELQWEWKLEPGGNSGLKYFVLESRNSAIGHEYQLLDDQLNPDGKVAGGKHVTASFYDVLKPAIPPPTKPLGEINQSKILVKGDHVEHWLNGVKVLEYECGSESVKAGVAESKFKAIPDFGNRIAGRLLLQDHHSAVWFRNIKIRDLTPAR